LQIENCKLKIGTRGLRGSLAPVDETSRRGAVLVEGAIVLSVFLLLVLGTLDLGTATYRYNTLAQAARQGARQAAVHGALAAPAMTTWGPTTYTGTAGDGSEYAQAVSPMLVGFPPSSVTIKVEWIDGGNAVQQRVRYTVSATYTPTVTSLFAKATYAQSAASTMPIAH
jgi:Flp pilus assembly protein TadG